MPDLHIIVGGQPQPQGSIAYKGMRGGKPIMVSDNEPVLKPWRAAIARAARAAVPEFWEPLDVPVRLVIVLRMPRPKRPMFPVPATKPDVDKLARAVMDGLADGDVYGNDSRVFSLEVRETFAAEDDLGADIWVVWG